MRILLFGGTGLLGWELRRALAPLGEIVAPSRAQVDLQDFDAVREIIRGVRPELVVNAAAYTDVDGAESEEDLAHAVNAVAPGVLAEEVQDLGGFLVHYSTDYVFDGEKGSAYQEDDDPNPVNVYGRTKLLGEKRISESGVSGLILRLSWLYAGRRENFLTKMLQLLQTRHKVEVVDDQTGSPTWSRDAAEVTSQIVTLLKQHGQKQGGGLGDGPAVFHFAAAGSVSRYEQASAIQRLGAEAFPDAGLETCSISTVPSEQYPQIAKRPPATPLNSGRLQNLYKCRLPDWDESLRRCIEEVASYCAPVQD